MIVDDDYEEEYDTLPFGTTFYLPAQINWGKDHGVEPITDRGAPDHAFGYVLFRSIDLRKKEVPEIKQGDRIVSIGRGLNLREVDLYVVRVVPMGHYQDRGGATLLKASFKDRHPADNRRGG